MTTHRRIRIILAGLLLLLVLIAAVFLSNSNSTNPPETAQVQDVEMIVQMLFAQTVVAEANAQANAQANIVIQLVGTATPTLSAAVFPDAALQTLRQELSPSSFTIVSTARATNPQAYFSLVGLPDEVWCVVISPPVSYVPSGFSTTARDRTHFLLRRIGLLWEVAGSGNSEDGEHLREMFLRGGCDNL